MGDFPCVTRFAFFGCFISYDWFSIFCHVGNDSFLTLGVLLSVGLVYSLWVFDDR